MTNELRVLLADDTPMLGAAVDHYLDGVDDVLDREAVLTTTSSLPLLKDLIAGGQTWDLALVDLDFGVGNETGLAYLDVLSAVPEPPALVLFTQAYDITRLLCCIAAVTWFDVVAVYNKIGVFTADTSKDIKSFRKLVHDATARDRSLRLPAHLRSETVRMQFTEIVNTPESLRNWTAATTENKAPNAAMVAGMSSALMSNWASKTAEELVPFWHQVRHAGFSDGMSTEAPAPLPPVEQDFYGAVTSLEADARQAAYPAVHGFAVSQTLFFNDPYVRSRANSLERQLHRKGPIATVRG